MHLIFFNTNGIRAVYSYSLQAVKKLEQIDSYNKMKLLPAVFPLIPNMLHFRISHVGDRKDKEMCIIFNTRANLK